MKLRLITFFLGFLLSSLVTIKSYAQTSFELEEIHASAKTLYVQPETLDRLMVRIRVIEKDLPAEQVPMLLETYRIIASQYVANNHFSQAYKVYSEYISFKEGATARNFVRTIDVAKQSIQERRLNDGSELMNLQNQVQQLQIDNDLLISKRLNFKKYFSFLIIALSAIFALMLVKSAMKLFSIRNQLKENREKMKSIHRIAALGNFSKGIVNQARQKTGLMEDLAQNIGTTLQENSLGDKNDLTLSADIRSQCKGIIKDLNDTGIEA